jgi:lysophospholipase L1-like esterase
VNRLAIIIAAALLAGACGSSTGPTPPPPPTEDPPKISCPALQPVQLTTGTSIAVPYTATTSNGRAPVTVICVPSSGSSFSVGQSTVTCTATDALQRTDTCAFAVTVLAPPRLSVTRFFAFGDSITKGEDGSAVIAPAESRFYSRVILPAPQTYPGALLQSLTDRYRTQSPSVRNEGNPSEAVTGPDTFSRFVALTGSNQYDAALIMEGTNDLYNARNGTGNPNTVIQLAVAGLRRMVADAKSRNLRPFLATIPPMNPAGFRGMVYGNEFVSGFNDSVRSVAAAENVPLVDVNQAFAGDLTLLSGDGVHPNAGGYQRIADTFFDAIRKSLEIPAATSTSPLRRP